MKNTIKLLALFLAFFANSCDFINPNLNIDPNNPSDVPMELLLPQAEVSFGYILGGDFGRYASLWTQHHSGCCRQHSGYEVYQLKEGDVNNAWNGIYSTTLKDLNVILEKANETGSPHFAGVAKILTANILGTLVDLFDAVPYSDALKGADNLRPAYDSGQDLYNTIQRLLSEANSDLSATSSTFKVGSTDLIFAGNLSKWKAYANTLSARYYLHTSEIDATAYSKALEAIGRGAIADNGGNAMVPFGDAASENNPWYQFESQRGDVVMGAKFIDLMQNSGDPRLPAFASENGGGGYGGALPGSYNDDPATISRVGSYYTSGDSPVPLALYTEAKFIEAEAALATDAARAATAYNDAVKASLAQVGVTDAAFITGYASETSGSITLDKILTQKYIAMYSTLEPFVDWRRKGIPALTPAEGTTQIARRFPYPQAERLFNNEHYVANVTVFDKVFWDK